MNQLECFIDAVDRHERIVFLGGAGVSTESGIPDFRSAGGLFGKFGNRSPERILSASFFKENPFTFFEYMREHIYRTGVEPNITHYKLAELEQAGKLKAVVTQNIDGLHQRAGSARVLELHGSIYRQYCTMCRTLYKLEAVLGMFAVPRCDCGGIIRPDVVLYEEPLDSRTVDEAICAIQTADMLIVGGTSLQVYPAAGLLEYFGGGTFALINKSATPWDKRADIVVREPLGRVFEKIELTTGEE